MSASPLRVGYVVRMFPRLSETFVLQEILELERQGAEVVVFSLERADEGRFHPGLTELNAPVVYLDALEPRKWWNWIPDHTETLGGHMGKLWNLIEETIPKRHGPSIDAVFTGAALAAKAAEADVQCLHAHFATASCTAAYYAHRITGIPYSFTAHAKDIFVHTVDEELLAAKIEAARFMVTVSEYNLRYLAERFATVDTSRIRVLYNGVDLQYFNPRERRPQHVPPLILGVGRLVAKKGFGDLVSACALLRERGVDFRCQILGKGREEAALRDLIAAHNLGAMVTLPGACTQTDVRRLMQVASVFCLPCKRDVDGNQDALPTVLLESLAGGVPVVSTRLAGIPEIVESGTEGLLTEPGDVPALADALARILTSPSLQTTFASNGRRKAEARFNLKNNVATLRGWLSEPDRSETAPSGITTTLRETI